MAEEKALVVFTEDRNGDVLTINGVKLDFVSGTGIDLLVKMVREAAILVPDLSTGKSRQEIASMSGKVSSSKVVLEKLGKGLVDDEKALIADRLKRVDGINATRAKIKTEFDALRDEVRAPLTQWEKDQAAEKARIALEIQIEACHAQALIDNEVFDQRLELAHQAKEVKLQMEELAIQQKAQKIAQEMVIEAARKAPEPSIKAAVEYAKTLTWGAPAEPKPDAAAMHGDFNPNPGGVSYPADPPALDKDDQVLNDILHDLKAAGLSTFHAVSVIVALERGEIRHLTIDRGDEW